MFGRKELFSFSNFKNKKIFQVKKNFELRQEIVVNIIKFMKDEVIGNLVGDELQGANVYLDCQLHITIKFQQSKFLFLGIYNGVTWIVSNYWEKYERWTQ